MTNSHKKISQTAFNHIIFRTFYRIPFAEEFEQIAEKLGLGSAAIFKKDILRKNSVIFEGRYKGGETALEKFIRENPACTILEIAAGFSLHGINLAKKFPGITYLETDLPEMIKMKKRIVKALGLNLPNLHFAPASALDLPALKKALLLAKPKRRIGVYCEGLLPYFTDNEKSELTENVKFLLDDFGGAWITPDPALSLKSRNFVMSIMPTWKAVAKKVEKLAKRKYDDHGFQGEKQADEFFEERGFKIKKIPWSTDLKSFKISGYKPKEIKEIKKRIKTIGKVWILTKK